jgi:hypothetical protein
MNNDDREYFDEVFGVNNKPIERYNGPSTNYYKGSNGILHRNRH